MMDLCGKTSTDDISKDLNQSEISKFDNSMNGLLELIKQCTNPFSPSLWNNHLYNISEGNKQSMKFISEAREHPQRLDQSKRKNKLVNFESKNTKKVNISGKVKIIIIQREIFERLLYASLQNVINIEKPLSSSSDFFCFLSW